MLVDFILQKEEPESHIYRGAQLSLAPSFAKHINTTFSFVRRVDRRSRREFLERNIMPIFCLLLNIWKAQGTSTLYIYTGKTWSKRRRGRHIIGWKEVTTWRQKVFMMRLFPFLQVLHSSQKTFYNRGSISSFFQAFRSNKQLLIGSLLQEAILLTLISRYNNLFFYWLKGGHMTDLSRVSRGSI